MKNAVILGLLLALVCLKIALGFLPDKKMKAAETAVVTSQAAKLAVEVTQAPKPTQGIIISNFGTGYSHSTGTMNTAVGHHAGFHVSSEQRNVFFGDSAVLTTKPGKWKK